MSLPTRLIQSLPYAIVLAGLLFSSITVGYYTSGDRGSSLNPHNPHPVHAAPDNDTYSILVQSEDGTVDSYPLSFRPEIVDASADGLVISGQDSNGVFHDLMPLPLKDGDEFVDISDSNGQPFKWWRDSIPAAEIPKGLPITPEDATPAWRPAELTGEADEIGPSPAPDQNAEEAR